MMIKMKTILFGLCLILVLKPISSDFCYNRNNFNHLVINLQWPTTFVEHNLRRRAGNQVALKEHRARFDYLFTIHGVWPQKTNSNGPTNCDHPDKFDVESINKIKKIDKFWTSFGMPTSDFWRYEWNKHGTCAAVLENLKTLEEYFRFAVVQADQFDTKVYQSIKNEYKPSVSVYYKTNALKAAIESLHGYKVQMKCWSKYLRSVQLCYDLELKQIDCGDDYRPKCNGDIMLPA